MVEQTEFSGVVKHPDGAGASEPDVWAQLNEFATRADADPVLRLLVSEAIANHQNLRGVTATIANRYRAMIDAVPDAITIHDEAGRILDANASACRLLDQDREVLLGRSMEDTFPELDANFVTRLHAGFDVNETVIASSLIHRQNGEETSLELNTHSYLDANQQRIIAITRDLGPRTLADVQLRNSEAELQRILHDMDMGVIVRNRMGHIMSSNPAACRILQMCEADLLALRSDQIGDWQVFDDSGASITQQDLPWSQAVRTGKAIESTVFGIKSPTMTGTHWVSITAIPHIDDGEGNLDHVVSIFTDITPIKQDSALFAYAQSLTNFGAWQLITGGEYMIWSSQMHAIFDVPLTTPVTRDRMLGHFTGMDQRRLRQALDTAKIGETTDLSARITTAIGRRRQVRIRLRALEQESTHGSVVGCVHDITAETDRENSDAIE